MNLAATRRGVAIGVVGLVGMAAGAGLAAYLAKVGPFVGHGGTLSARIVDETTGRPVAARIAVTDTHGAALTVADTPETVDCADRHWSYVDGAFRVDLPPTGATIEIRRGLETRPLVEHVVPARGGRGISRVFRLRRWTDMRARGYVSGDLHAHLPALAVAPLQMRAEDLNALNLLILGGLQEPNDHAFTGRVDSRSDAAHQIYLSQEIVDWHMGHLTLAGLTALVPGYPVGCGTLEYWTSNPHCDTYRAARVARTQGALVTVAHFENLPGAATPAGVALGLIDALELPTWGDPMQLPAHLGVWSQSGYSTAEFPPMRGVDYYYQFLNAGFRLPIAAGTDKVGPDMPIGSNRTYVPTNGETSFSAWTSGIKAGKGFVTNGPLLEFDVNGHGPGDVIAFHDAITAQVRVTARSIVPFTTLEVLMNGRAVAHTLKLVQTNPPVDGVYTLVAEATVPIDRSCWFAARAWADPDITPRTQPRQVAAFAHSNPVFVLRDGAPVREDAALAYVRKATAGLRHWLSTGPRFVSDADRQAVQRDADLAVRAIEGR